MSAVLWEFAMPVLEPLEELEPAEVEARIKLAMLAWNGSILEQSTGDADFWRKLPHLPKSTPQECEDFVDEALAFLRKRKAERYADDRRIVLSIQLTPEYDSYHLSAVSTPCATP